jgi:hypothetical protein
MTGLNDKQAVNERPKKKNITPIDPFDYMRTSKFIPYMNLLSALTRQLPQEDQPFEIHHDGKRIPIKLEHLGAKVSKIAINVDPPSIVINQDNPFYMGGISKNAAWFIACNQYAAYVISGPLACEQAQQKMDYSSVGDCLGISRN